MFEKITGYNLHSIDHAIKFMEDHYHAQTLNYDQLFPDYGQTEKYDCVHHQSLPSKTLEEMEVHWMKRDKGEVHVSPTL